MRNVECTLLSTTITSNSIGVQVETETRVTIPIIHIEDIYAREFYDANEQGHRPTLRLRVSTLNYSGEEELEYNGAVYSIIRTQEEVDEMILICERKVKNG